MRTSEVPYLDKAVYFIECKITNLKRSARVEQIAKACRNEMVRLSQFTILHYLYQYTVSSVKNFHNDCSDNIAYEVILPNTFFKHLVRQCQALSLSGKWNNQCPEQKPVLSLIFS
jgi:hypothetical protein